MTPSGSVADSWLTRLRLPMSRSLQTAVILLSVLLTLAAAWNSHRLQQERRELRFERDSDRLGKLLEQRLSRYEDLVQAGIAALDAAGGDMSHQDWARFAAGLRLSEHYPGVDGIGVVQRVEAAELQRFEQRVRVDRSDYQVHPIVDQPIHLPVRFIAPSTVDKALLGLDMSAEPLRREAASDALLNDRPRITAPLYPAGNGTPARFLFFAPYPGEQSALVFTPFDAAELLQGPLAPEQRMIDIALHDGDQTVLDERGPQVSAQASGQASALQRDVQMEVYGRVWRMSLSARPAFMAATRSIEARLVLIGGLILNTLLLCVFLSFARMGQALRASARLSSELDERGRLLEESNRELERFACVASHDLKTPLRGIGDLTWYLREDLETYLGAPGADPSVGQHLDRLERQTHRMEALIDGILDYSGIGRPTHGDDNAAITSSVDVAAALRDLRDTLGVSAEALVLTGEHESVMTHEVPFLQVLSNLVGNAFKYHHDRAKACVTVSLQCNGMLVTLTVTDNGPGIDPRFHERIFEMFETLQPKDEIESTGIGLAIVKKLVDSRGGSIVLESQPGEGSRFIVHWPLDPVARAAVTSDRSMLKAA